MAINLRELLKDKKEIILFIILILSVFSMAWLLNGREVNTISTDKTVAYVNAGETVNFTLIFVQEGGFFDEHYEMTDFEIEGNWVISMKGTSIYVSADSRKEIKFSINTPENAEDGDDYYYEFALINKPTEHTYEIWSFHVHINNSVSSEIAEGFGFSRSEGKSLQYTPLVLIPIIIIVFCIILLYKMGFSLEKILSK
jgi:hypothetical protein